MAFKGLRRVCEGSADLWASTLKRASRWRPRAPKNKNKHQSTANFGFPCYPYGRFGSSDFADCVFTSEPGDAGENRPKAVKIWNRCPIRTWWAISSDTSVRLKNRFHQLIEGHPGHVLPWFARDLRIREILEKLKMSKSNSFKCDRDGVAAVDLWDMGPTSCESFLEGRWCHSTAKRARSSEPRYESCDFLKMVENNAIDASLDPQWTEFFSHFLYKFVGRRARRQSYLLHGKINFFKRI